MFVSSSMFDSWDKTPSLARKYLVLWLPQTLQFIKIQLPANRTKCTERFQWEDVTLDQWLLN